MVELIGQGAYLVNGKYIVKNDESTNVKSINNILKSKGEASLSDSAISPETCKKNTIAYSILQKHNTSGDSNDLKMKFDAMASHDITYVGIVQTARASGLTKFPLPYVLTNCHNSLCAVGGTINEDDHMFGLSAAKKYGGIYVPAHIAVIHQYMREMMSGCGKMLLGSDSHTRYGALGTMAIGEGGPELVKQLLSKTYDVKYPEVVGVYLEGNVGYGVGPQDVALAIIGAVFKNGFVKNKVMEFVGPGIENLSVDFRNGIDVMTTETACLTSIWCTDDKVQEYFDIHGRKDEYSRLAPGNAAYYDGIIKVDLDKIEPMIALPFHPSNAYKISDVKANPYDILHKVEEEGRKQFNNEVDFTLVNKIVDGKVKVDQAVIAGCSGGTFENICAAADILKDKSIGNGALALSVYPASQPVYFELNKIGAINTLIEAGVTVKTAFCGPCFGAGDVPSNNGLSIRHSTRNFPNREGSKPGNGQIASVALMDARSIAATAANGGILTSAAELDVDFSQNKYHFDDKIYKNRVFFGYQKGDTNNELKFGPNIKDWPEMTPLPQNIVLKLVTYIDDPVTTTDELIPSGETSSYRSNPMKLSEFALSRKDPLYVGNSKKVQKLEHERLSILKENKELSTELKELLATIKNSIGCNCENMDILKTTGIGSVIFANKPGDGSAREQAASCQKVLGGWANIALEYATKRYRSNLINWGLLPFTTDEEGKKALEKGSLIYISGIKSAVETNKESIEAYVIKNGEKSKIILKLSNLSSGDREIIKDGCLINYYKEINK